MARRRLEQPYASYDRENNSLLQSTHAPGQGGSSGAAIGVLSNWPQFRPDTKSEGAPNMALPSRYVSTGSRFNSWNTAPGAYDQANRIDSANRAAYEGAMEEQNRARNLEERAWNRRVSNEDRSYEMDRERFGLDRDRFGLEGEVARGRLGMQGTLANALAQALGQRQQFFGGANDTPPWMRGGRAESEYGAGLDLREPTRNYLMRFLRG